MLHRICAAPAAIAAALLLLPVSVTSLQAAPSTSGVAIKELPDRLRVEIDGELFTEYRYQGASRPHLYPLLAPGGIAMSRQWPMEAGENEEHDHPHHRSLWFAHGEINSVDFWSESQTAGRTVHDHFLEVKSGPNLGLIRTTNKLLAKDGTQIGTIDYAVRFHPRRGIRLLDFEAALRATHGELHLGDTKEGTFAIRLAETMRLKPNKQNAGKPGGHIVNSEGVTDGATWGKRARWVDYYGPVDGKTMGVAIFDHPTNPRHPTWWHVRDYGLFAANPFGIHDFEQKPAGAGDLKVPAGESRTFRYRIILHPGTDKDANISALWTEYGADAK